MTSTNLLLLVLVGLVAFAAMPQWIALVIGLILGVILKINVPKLKGMFSWN